MKEIKIVSLLDVIDHIVLSREFWDRTNGMDEEAKSAAIRQEVYSEKCNMAFLSALKGKTPEEQMEYYCIAKNSVYDKTSYGEITKSNMKKHGCALKDYKGLKALIVDNGVIIGVGIDAFAHDYKYGKPAFPYERIVTYIGIDNDGAGTSECVVTAQLCPVLPDSDK